MFTIVRIYAITDVWREHFQPAANTAYVIAVILPTGIEITPLFCYNKGANIKYLKYREIDMKKVIMTVFGVISAIALAAFDVICGVWATVITIEQINTGWGHGTDLELVALVPIMMALISLSALIVGALYILFALILKERLKPLLIINGIGMGLLSLEIILIFLFLHF